MEESIVKKETEETKLTMSPAPESELLKKTHTEMEMEKSPLKEEEVPVKKKEEVPDRETVSYAITDEVLMLAESADQTRLEELAMLPSGHIYEPMDSETEPDMANKMDMGAMHHMIVKINEAPFSELSDVDKNRVLNLIQKNIPRLTAKNSFKDLTENDLDNLFEEMKKRLPRIDDFKSILAGDQEYKAYFLNCLVLEKDRFSLSSFKLRKRQRKELADTAYAYLNLNPRYRQKDVRLRILKGQDISGKKKLTDPVDSKEVTRAKERLDQIQGLNLIVKDVFAAIHTDPPVSFYEFRKTKLDPGFPRSEAENIYYDYLKKFFKDIAAEQGGKDEMFIPQSFQGKKLRTWSSLGELIKKNCYEYGTSAELGEVTRVMGDKLYAEKNEEYRDSLYQAMVLVSSVQPPEETEDTKRLDERLNALFKGPARDYSVLREPLLKDRRIVEHLAADSDSEFESFLETAVPACRAIMDELQQHIYVDQYLIEREKVIGELVISGETSKVPGLLALNDLDQAIEATKIGKKTFKDLFKEQQDAANKTRGKDGALDDLFRELILSMGALACFDQEALRARKNQLDGNLRTLRSTFEEVWNSLPEKERTIGKNFLFDMLIQSEKQSLFRSGVEEYGKSIKEHAQLKVNEFLLEEKERRYAGALRLKKEEFGRRVKEERRKGRTLINLMLDTSHKEFSLLSPKDLDETEPGEEIRYILQEAAALAEDFAEEPFLSALCQAVMKEMVAAAKDNDLDRAKRSRRTLLRFKGFSEAVDRELLRRPDLIRSHRASFKQGLFEMYAPVLLNDAEEVPETGEEAPKYYDELLSTLFATPEARSILYNFFIDTDTYAGQDQASPEDTEAFMNMLVISAAPFQELPAWVSLKKKLDGLGPDETRIFAWFIQNSDETALLQNAITHVVRQSTVFFPCPEESSTVMSYLRGDYLSEGMIGLDYRRVLRLLQKEPSRFISRVKDAAEKADELMRIRQHRRTYVPVPDEDEPADMDLVRLDMANVMTMAENCRNDLKKEKGLTNEEKLWRYYLVIHTCSDVFDRYERCMELGWLKKEDKETLAPLFWSYAMLQDFFASENKDPELVKRVYMSDLAKDLGILDAPQDLEKEIKKDERHQHINALIHEHTATRTNVLEQERKLHDQDQEDFPKDVVAAVKKVDRWIAEHSLRRYGDSDTRFLLDILNRPIRDRLFVYYLVENKRERIPTELDAALSVQGYVPNVANFAKKLKKNILICGMNLARRIDLVNDTGLMDSIGKYETTKIERALRLLDNQSLGLSRYLELAVEAKKPYDDPNLPEEVKTRQLCYISFMEEMAGYRAAILGKTEKEMLRSEEIKHQLTRLERSLRRLIRANEAVRKLGIEDRLTKEFSSSEDTGAWSFDGEKMGKLVHDTPLLSRAGAISNLAAAITAAKGVLDSDLSALGRAKNIFNTVEKLGNAFAKGSSFGSLIDSPFDPYGKPIIEIIGKTVSVIGSGGKLVTSTVQLAEIYKSEDGAVEIVKKDEEKKKETGRTEEPLSKLDGVTIVKNSAAVEKRATKFDIFSSGLRIAGSASTIVSSAIGIVSEAVMPIPYMGSIASTLSNVFTIARLICNYWAKKDQREQTVDEFLKMDELFGKVMPEVMAMGPEGMKLYGYDPMEPMDVFKENVRGKIRKEVLRQLHYSGMQEFVIDITHEYAAVIHRHIFFDENGERIYADNQKAIDERKDLRGLFPNLKFVYPKGPEEFPHPDADKIGWDMARGIM